MVNLATRRLILLLADSNPCEPETEEAMAAELQRTSPRELLFPEDFEPVNLMASRNGNRAAAWYGNLN